MERLVTLRFRLTFAENCRLLTEQMQLLNDACRFLHQSREMKSLLEVSAVLPIGKLEAALASHLDHSRRCQPLESDVTASNSVSG